MLTIAMITVLSACQSNKNPEETNTTAGTHSVVVEEVLQTSQYTYIHAKEGLEELWLAAPKMQATVGEILYFKEGLPMKDFESKELNRTFKDVLFLDNLSTSPTIIEKNHTPPHSQSIENTTSSNTANAENSCPANMHSVIAEEIIQTSQYTYIRAKEGNNELWLATVKMEAAVGEKYYFKGGLPMTDFESKALKRIFKEILFLDNISTEPTPAGNNNSSRTENNTSNSTGSDIPLEKKEIKLNHQKDDITIAALLENKNKYSNKTIKIKGQVTKFSSGIMKKNWIHIQDGTEFSGKFDLTITTNQEVKVGENVTFKGEIALDKDFGYGYNYDVIMEDAILIK